MCFSLEMILKARVGDLAALPVSSLEMQNNVSLDKSVTRNIRRPNQKQPQ